VPGYSVDFEYPSNSTAEFPFNIPGLEGGLPGYGLAF
jgi:hypothetical protein